MMILSMRTDKPEAEIGLFDDDRKIAYDTWEAHRQLAETLHSRIKNLLEGSKKLWSDIEGIVVFEGPGSFTGLRIGISVANALAYSNDIPVVGSGGSDDWLEAGLKKIVEDSATRKPVLPHYGSDAHITTPKK